MKIFEPQNDLTSYTYPIVKITTCLSMIILGFIINRIFQISNLWVNFAVTLLCAVVLMASTLCLYISIGELFIAHENRKKKNNHSLEVKQLTIEAVTKIVSENDIVEIEVCTNNKTIKIGASAECKYTSFIFENKLFYISKSEYETIELFTEALTELFPKGIIPVSKIDDLPLKFWRLS